MFKAEIVADSISPQGDRLTTLLITFPRFILAEINTHRMLSKNTSSSRAVPFKKMVEAVQNNPFTPIAWQKHHSGMQGSEYFPMEAEFPFENITNIIQRNWLLSRDNAVEQAIKLNELGVTKQLCNRLLEPFMWTTMLITGSKEGWDNFFELRCPVYEYTDHHGQTFQFKSRKECQRFAIARTNLKEDEGGIRTEICNADLTDNLFWLKINKGQAEIHMMHIAEMIYDAMNESTPKQLQEGQWHIPFEDKISSNVLDWSDNTKTQAELWGRDLTMYKIKVSVAMAARTSYTVVGDEKEVDYEKMIKLHDKLIELNHRSPLEHCARAMSDEEYFSYHKGLVEGEFDSHPEIGSFFRILEEPKFMKDNRNGWIRNFKGFIQYRHFVEEKKLNI